MAAAVAFRPPCASASPRPRIPPSRTGTVDAGACDRDDARRIARLVSRLAAHFHDQLAALERELVRRPAHRCFPAAPTVDQTRQHKTRCAVDHASNPHRPRRLSLAPALPLLPSPPPPYSAKDDLDDDSPSDLPPDYTSTDELAAVRLQLSDALAPAPSDFLQVHHASQQPDLSSPQGVRSHAKKSAAAKKKAKGGATEEEEKKDDFADHNGAADDFGGGAGDDAAGGAGGGDDNNGNGGDDNGDDWGGGGWGAPTTSKKKKKKKTDGQDDEEEERKKQEEEEAKRKAEEEAEAAKNASPNAEEDDEFDSYLTPKQKKQKEKDKAKKRKEEEEDRKKKEAEDAKSKDDDVTAAQSSQDVWGATGAGDGDGAWGVSAAKKTTKKGKKSKVG